MSLMTTHQHILDAASRLFAERGFHRVSVHDIGAECGISGPALYKHFAGKGDLLDQALTQISERLLAEGRRRVGASAGASAQLDSLIDWHVDFAISHPELIMIQEREWSNLSDIARKHLRDRQLRYIDLWVATVRQLRDDLSPAEGRALVQAVFGLLNSTPHSARIGAPRMRTLLARAARTALLG
jgi:AcrR family transcriptional regulator